MRGWIALAAAWSAAATALASSAALAIATGLIFHLHPVVIGIASAWLYRRIEGARPCPTRSVAFLIGLGALLSGTDEALRPRGLADAPWLAAAIGLTALVGAAWVLLRPESPPTLRQRARRPERTL